MYRLYLAMKERSSDEITAKEIAVASGKEAIDPGAMADWLHKYESSNTTIQTAFEKQVEAAAVCCLFLFTDDKPDIPKGPWDREKFEDLLAKWIVATDQPFYTVDEPEFRGLLTYIHHPSPNLKIPHRNAVRRRIMKMGACMIEDTKQMFTVRITICC
jgi:hypothetical protein